MRFKVSFYFGNLIFLQLLLYIFYLWHFHTDHMFGDGDNSAQPINFASETNSFYGMNNVKNASPVHERYNVNKSIAVSIMGCARFLALNLSLKTLHSASLRYFSTNFELIPVYVSLDCWNSKVDMESVVNFWNQSHFLVYFSWFSEAFEERDNQWSDERVARHWLSSVDALFSMGYDYVVHMEEDHAVALNFFTDLVNLLSWAPHSTTCFNMGCGGDCWGSFSENPKHVTWMEAGNMGVVYARSFWDKFFFPGLLSRFCGMRGNWDINIHILQSEGTLPQPCATYALPRVGHMQNVGSARNDHKSVDVPQIYLKESESGGKDLIDMGMSNYVLEKFEQGSPLPQNLKDKCTFALAQSSKFSKIFNLKTKVLQRLRQEKHVEGRDCTPHFMEISDTENTFFHWKRRETPRRIVVMSPYDCELDMLLFKLEEMGQWLDFFVIVESSVSNSNRPRNMCFNANLVKESSYASKIVFTESHEKVMDFKYWEQEVHVKNQLGLPLFHLGLENDDLVIMMDMDEVISEKHLKMMKYYDHPSTQTAFQISLRWSYYGFEWINPEPTVVNAIVSWGEFQTACQGKANAIRFNLCGLAQSNLLKLIGWHCSWCFAKTEQFIEKIEKSSKLEDNHEKYKDIIFLEDQRRKGLWFVDGKPNACYDLANMK